MIDLQPARDASEATVVAPGTEARLDAGKPVPMVYAITLNWNGKNDTLELLDSLRRVDYPDCCVVVVDNGSEDGSVAAIARMFPGVTVIENGRNLGYAEGFNVGI